MHIGEQQIPPEENMVASALDQAKTRRQVLRYTGAAAAIGVALEADQLITGLFWGDNDTQFKVLSECAELCTSPDWYANELTVGIPGMDHKSGEPTARALAKEALDVPGSGKIIGYIDVSDLGVSYRSYAMVFSEAARHCERLSFGGQSLGGAVPLDIAVKLRQMIRGRVINFGRCVFYDSPGGLDCAQNGGAEVGSKISRAYKGGILGRTAINYFTEPVPRRDVVRGPLSRLINSFVGATEGDSPRLSPSGLRFLADMIDLEHDWRELKPHIDSETRGLYVVSDLDNVVWNEKSAERIGNVFIDCGAASFDIVPSRPNTGHANVEVGSAVARSWFEATNHLYA